MKKTLNLDFVELETLERGQDVCLMPCPCSDSYSYSFRYQGATYQGTGGLALGSNMACQSFSDIADAVSDSINSAISGANAVASHPGNGALGQAALAGAAEAMALGLGVEAATGIAVANLGATCVDCHSNNGGGGSK